MIKSRYVQLNIQGQAKGYAFQYNIYILLVILMLKKKRKKKKRIQKIKNINRMGEHEAGGWGRHREFHRFQPRF